MAKNFTVEDLARAVGKIASGETLRQLQNNEVKDKDELALVEAALAHMEQNQNNPQITERLRQTRSAYEHFRNKKETGDGVKDLLEEYLREKPRK